MYFASSANWQSFCAVQIPLVGCFIGKEGRHHSASYRVRSRRPQARCCILAVSELSELENTGGVFHDLLRLVVKRFDLFEY